ncbi:AAA family ATPase [Mycobacterium hodleri]|uniref:AAA family ATPase n=1 Tax=Mycolicibacterium hodleri TaxID=49897 RepID=A0A544VWI1_9MYCO|nr:ATP-binding protein [Mycolicibacterium hodleri]TQR84343.1 AAA family ATPase [Mycolicibacterium hodleri]
MDAQHWHDYCVADLPPEPPALTVRQWTRLDDAARCAHTDALRRWLEHLYVQTDELAAISAQMTDTVRANAESPPGAKQVLAVTGPNVVGKSTLMMRWARSRYLDWTGEAEHDRRGRPVLRPTLGCEADLCPVVWINLPAGAKIKDVDVEILEFFGLPGHGVTRNLYQRALRAAERHRSRVLIVDDAHLLKTDWKGGRDVLDHVKHINTELGEIGATLILVGANLEGGDLVTDPQIAGRLTLHRFPRYDIDSMAERRTWQVLVRQLEDTVAPHLPKGAPGMLFTELAGELWLRTQGYLGEVTELVRRATLAATADGTHKILRRHLAAVTLSERAESERRDTTSPRRLALAAPPTE